MAIKPNPPAPARSAPRAEAASRAGAQPPIDVPRSRESLPISYVDEHPNDGAKAQFLAKRDSWSRVLSGLRAPQKGASPPSARRPELIAFLEEDGSSGL